MAENLLRFDFQIHFNSDSLFHYLVSTTLWVCVLKQFLVHLIPFYEWSDFQLIYSFRTHARKTFRLEHKIKGDDLNSH